HRDQKHAPFPPTVPVCCLHHACCVVGCLIGSNHHRRMVKREGTTSARAEGRNNRSQNDGTFDARFCQAELQRESPTALPFDAARGGIAAGTTLTSVGMVKYSNQTRTN